MAVAWGVLHLRAVLRILWLTCVLSVASATAWAQSVPVDRALVAERSSEQKLSQLLTQRAQLLRRYQEQLSAIDRVKKEKPSWRRDRELNSLQADANDTAAKVTANDRALKGVQNELATAKRIVLASIDAEMASGAPPQRTAELARLRLTLAPAVAPKKIVIPNAEIDPLADPEELERQASAIDAVVKQLDAQRRGLDQQEQDLRMNDELRRQHERAHELNNRDDDQPHRAVDRGGAAKETHATPTSGGTGGSDSAGGSFGSDRTASALETTAVMLGEVIDRSTIEGLQRASHSMDPKQRADAAAAARDAVQKRIDELRRKQKMIEQRAKQLRGR